ncbi:alkaline phosphatase [Parelusimicrobium proximum]|uniref:alkaline phosphatase n=1 Tax=Parelusimicrobium proximum TaxID=3228953 RepID=UPI003D1764B4
MKKGIIAGAVIKLLVVIISVGLTSGGLSAKDAPPAKAKNVIYFIGDGMGPQAMGMLIQYARLAPNSIYADRQSNLEKAINMGELGIALTNTKTTIVTDSAGSGTQLAGGEYSLPLRIGMNADGGKTSTILELAQKRGLSTGLVTTSYLQDATPSAFAAHQMNRKERAAISEEMVKANIDIMLGGGLKYARESQTLGIAEEKGYSVVYNKSELAGAKGKILGYFGESATPFAIEKNADMPTLSDMTLKALETLKTNKKGFFLMVEAGKIDWTEHDNDAGATLHEMLEFDKALGHILEFVRKSKDTILIITADHETGGFGFNYRKEAKGEKEQVSAAGEVIHGGDYYVDFKVLDELYNQNKSYFDMSNEYKSLSGKNQTPEQLAIILSSGLGRQISRDFVVKHGGSFDKVKAAIDYEQGIVWASHAHTSTPVMVVSVGNKISGYTGVYHTTDLAGKIMQSLQLK